MPIGWHSAVCFSSLLFGLLLTEGCGTREDLSSPPCAVQTASPSDIVLEETIWEALHFHPVLMSVRYDGWTEAGKLQFTHLKGTLPSTSSDTETFLLEPKAGERVPASKLGGSYGFLIAEVHDDGRIMIIVEPKDGCPQ